MKNPQAPQMKKSQTNRHKTAQEDLKAAAPRGLDALVPKRHPRALVPKWRHRGLVPKLCLGTRLIAKLHFAVYPRPPKPSFGHNCVPKCHLGTSPGGIP